MVYNLLIDDQNDLYKKSDGNVSHPNPQNVGVHLNYIQNPFLLTGTQSMSIRKTNHGNNFDLL
jgi:hypothetical protein